MNKKNILIGAALLVATFSLAVAGQKVMEIVARDGGGAASLQGKVDVPNSPYYKDVDFYNMKNNGSLVMLTNFKTYQQTTGYTCGPVAALTVVEYLNGKAEHSEMEMAKLMGTSTTTGTDTKGMVKYFDTKKWKVKSSLTDKTPADMKAFKEFVLTNLKNNVPIIVENVDWGGHWRVIIGYDTMGSELTANDVLIVADPYDTTDHKQDGYGIVPAERFFHMWFDAKLFPKEMQNQQWLTVEPIK